MCAAREKGLVGQNEKEIPDGGRIKIAPGEGEKRGVDLRKLGFPPADEERKPKKGKEKKGSGAKKRDERHNYGEREDIKHKKKTSGGANKERKGEVSK